MAAGPETQHQAASLQATGYTPVETKLNPPIQLPGTGELWAKVGDTAMRAVAQAGDMLRKSPLNPEVRAQMDYAIDNYRYGQSHIAWLKSKGNYGQMTTGLTPEGVTTVPGGTTSIDSMIKMGLLDQGTGGGGGGDGKGKGHDVDETPHDADESEKPATAPTSRTDVQTDAEGVQWFYNPTTSNWERLQTSPGAAKPSAPATKPALRPKDRPKDPSDLLTLNTQVPSKGGSTAALTAGDTGIVNTGQSQSSDIEAVPATQSTPMPSGTGAGAPQGPPAAPSMFARSSAAAPPAAPTVSDQGPQMTLGATAQPPPGMELQQDKAALASWQAQNAHPVASSSDAVNWAKGFDTRTQDATYLPHGGPNAEPAYAFHLKGGGTNIVPISQMVKNGFGPSVAGQNTSTILSASDAMSQQPPGQGQSDQLPSGQTPAAPPAPDMALAATTQPPSGVASFGQPPAAPTGQGMTDVYGNPLSAYTNVPSKGGPGDVTAGTSAAGQPTEPGAAQPPVPNVGTEKPLNHLVGHSPEELSKMDNDPDAGNFAGFDWHQDRHDGRFYTTMKSPSSTLNEQRNYWGGPGWQDMPMEESNLRQALRDAVRDTRGITFSDAETRDMPIGDVKFWLEEAKYLKDTGGDPSGTTALHIKGTTQQAQSITRMIDAIEAAKKAGVDPVEYSQAAEEFSKESGESGAHKLPPGELFYPQVPGQKGVLGIPYINPGAVWQMFLENWHRAHAGGKGQIHPLADELTREAQYFAGQMAQTPGITYTAEGKPENRGTEFSVAGIPIHLPGGTDTSPLQQINRIFQSQPPDDVIRGLKDVRRKLYEDINSSTDLATRLKFRTPPSFKAVQTAINNEQDLPDKTNKFRDKNGNVIMPDELRSSGATAQPTPMAEFDNVEDGANFAKRNKSGTRFKVRGQTFEVD